MAETYRAFWPHYVAQHRREGTRRWHVAGTLCAIALLAGGVAEPWLLLAVPLAGYGPAWGSHALIERNRPATFRHPLYSLVGDLHMTWLWCKGRMGDEVRRLAPDGP